MNAISTLAVIALFASCKPASSSNPVADAALVAAGQEALLSSGSVPEPVFSPKLSPEDLDATRHQLGDAFTRAEVASFQVAGSSLTGTPPELQGIWWMDGNPIPDETVTFAGVDFSQEKPLLPVFGSNNFSFHAGLTRRLATVAMAIGLFPWRRVFPSFTNSILSAASASTT